MSVCEKCWSEAGGKAEKYHDVLAKNEKAHSHQSAMTYAEAVNELENNLHDEDGVWIGNDSSLAALAVLRRAEPLMEAVEKASIQVDSQAGNVPEFRLTEEWAILRAALAYRSAK